MFLTGSFLLIFLTGGLKGSPPLPPPPLPPPVAEETPGPTQISEYVPGDDDVGLPGPIPLPEDFPGQDNNNGGSLDDDEVELPEIPEFLPEDDDDVEIRWPIKLPDDYYSQDHNNGRSSGPTPLPDDYPGQDNNIDGSTQFVHQGHYPGNVDIHGGKRPGTCGQRGTFDSPEFDDTYRLNISNPPEYLKEYYASFNEIQADPCDTLCSYSWLIDALKLEEKKQKFTMSRPVENHRTLTYVYLEMSIAAILDVKENDQLFIAHIWLYMAWHNKFIFWRPEELCGMKHIIVPTDTLWKPDVIIEEMVEKDKTAPSPFLKINSFGEVELRIDQVVTGSCHIDVYKFPFDVQQCTISFKSLLHSDEEIRFVVNKNSTVVSKWATNAMQSQHEWMFVKVAVGSKTTSFYSGANQTAIVYMVFMQRRAALHTANFLLPIFFFLVMDLASFLIPDDGGEKISFRITVLLAVTVLQLILHEILPCSSEKLPLIAVYCLGVFLMMLISLLEAILARYLIQKDSETEAERGRNSERRASCLDASREAKNCSRHSSLRHTQVDQTPSETKEADDVKPPAVTLDVTKAADELEDDRSVFRKEEEEPGYWTRRVKKLNRGFFVLYLVTAAVFLVYMLSLWSRPADDES